MKLGKKPARINAAFLNFSAYVDTAVLSAPPEFGHDRAAADYGLLGNDIAADSVWAGAAHETMIWAAESGDAVTFTPGAVLSDYAAVTGYDLEDPATDRGTDMQEAASYRRRIGVLDATGRRHQVAAYMALTPGDPDELALAAYIFGAVGVGLRLPDYAKDEFTAGKPWAVRHGVPGIEGGHYVSVVGRRDGMFDVVTWGRVHQMDGGFYRRYCDEALAYVLPDMLTAASPVGFNLGQLRADLEAFTRR